MQVPNEVKKKFLAQLQYDWLRADCDIRWLQTQIVGAKKDALPGLQQQLEQLKFNLKTFEEMITIQNNLP